MKEIACGVTLMTGLTLGAAGVGDVIRGFEVKEIRTIPDFAGRIWRMEYAKNGADLVWLECDDANKTFAVAFKTLPSDDTGIAHVMEHSVLCGSEKYPVKEPFVELLKSSLATFINAYTGSDQTVYPVCSRNDRDLLNLAGVYLDSVFHPLSVKTDRAMRQEKAIVRNEMKGAFSNPDRRALQEAERLLFPTTTYGRCSGGDPDAVPSLSFDAYTAFHARFYHPSNARVFLYGRVDLEPLLALLDSYLGAYGRADPRAETARQEPLAAERTLAYENRETKDRTIVLDAWAYGSFADRVDGAAMALVCDLLTDSNEAPLKKAMLASGLCDDVDLFAWSGFQNTVFLMLRNVKDGEAAACRRLVRETLARVAKEGLDREGLAAKIDRYEFKTREMDTGNRGLAYLSSVLDFWLHGGDPVDGIEFSSVFSALRSRLGTGYYERLISSVLLDGPHRAALTMTPVAPAEKPAEEQAVKEEPPADSPDDLAKLPKLRLADIPARGAYPTWRAGVESGLPVVRPEVAANGIVYVTLAFDLGGLSEEELLDLPLLADALGELGTAAHPPLALKRELEAKLGAFGVSTSVSRTGSRLKVGLSFLPARADEALALLGEILRTTKFDDAKALGDLRRQRVIGMERSLLSRGDAFARRRAAADLTRAGRESELFDGVTQLEYLRKGASGELAALARKVFVRSRLKVMVAGREGEGFVAKLAALFAEGTADGAAERKATVALAPLKASASMDPSSKGGFTALAARLPDGVAYSGAFKVASRILALGHIWTEVRVKGGAYGGTLRIDRDGDVSFLSWRDPTPLKTFGVFEAAGDALKAFVVSGEPIEQYQVASVGTTEPSVSVSSEANAAFGYWLDGLSTDDLQREREEIVGTTSADLLKTADLLKALAAGTNRVVIVDGEAFSAK